MSVKARLHKKSIQKIKDRLLDPKVQPYTKNMIEDPEIQKLIKKNNLSRLQAFERLAGFNPNRLGIGEEAQIEEWKSKGFDIKKFNATGKESRILCSGSNGLVILPGTKRNSLNKVENTLSFDSVIRYERHNILLWMKLTDEGNFSKNTGGGGQRKVLREVVNTVSVIKEWAPIFEDKPTYIYMVNDGRYSIKIKKAIDECIQKNNIINQFLLYGTTEELCQIVRN